MATPRAHMTVRRGRHRLFQSLEGTAILDTLILDELATSMLCRRKELGESRQWAYCKCHLSNPVVERWLWNNGQIPIGCSKTVLTLWWESTTEIWAKTWICLVFRNMFGKWLYIQWQASNRLSNLCAELQILTDVLHERLFLNKYGNWTNIRNVTFMRWEPNGRKRGSGFSGLPRLVFSHCWHCHLIYYNYYADANAWKWIQ